MDQAPSKEVNCLHSILAISDIAALDVDHPHDRVKNGSLEEGMGGEANCNNHTAGPSICNRLLEGLLGNSKQKHRVSSESLGRGSLDIGDKILRFGEVDVGLSI